jgi:hypothetical protein
LLLKSYLIAKLFDIIFMVKSFESNPQEEQKKQMEEDAKLRAAEIGDESQAGSEEFETKIESSEKSGDKKSLYETGKETVSAVTERAKAKWEKVKGGLSKGAGWLKEKMMGAGYMAVGAGAKTVEGVKAAGGKVKEGVEGVYNKASEKYDALTARGRQAYENVKGRARGAKNKCFDAIYQMRLDRLNNKQGKEQAKLDQIMREKVNPLRARIDEIRRKKEEIKSRMSGEPSSFEASAATAPA